jgi:hypothetical protein
LFEERQTPAGEGMEIYLAVGGDDERIGCGQDVQEWKGSQVVPCGMMWEQDVVAFSQVPYFFVVSLWWTVY